MKKLLLFLAVSFYTSFGFTQTEIESAKVKNIAFTQRYSAAILGGERSSYSFMINNGIRFKKHFEFTVGLGIEQYYNRKYVPMVLDVYYKILNKPVTPIIKISGGYLFDMERNGSRIQKNYGLSSGISFGVRISSFDKINISTLLGYRYLLIEKSENYYWGWGMYPPPTQEMHLNRLELRIELGFK